MTEPLYKYPRIYLDASFVLNDVIELEQAHLHYLRNVLRKQEGDLLRVFNGRDGEWLTSIRRVDKKGCAISMDRILREQPIARAPVHLYFAPIKKQRMDILIEKAVELGVSGLHPVLTNRTVMRSLNFERLNAQIIEASEQCERMDIPVLYQSITLDELISGGLEYGDLPFYACIERAEKKSVSECGFSEGAAFLIGPEGGFDPEEIAKIEGNNKVTAITLGDNILRAETAALACLSYIRLIS